MTMNSPDSLLRLYELVSFAKPPDEALDLAEFVREIGLKCLGFNGVGEDTPNKRIGF